MRPGQNKRMRGRNNNNNRKGPNPLTRSYESNGPDVKIRGTAHHIGEKYLQLARDAQSSGDPVMAESYLQHAEHYFRLIAAAQQAQQQAQFGYQRPPGEQVEVDEESDDDDFTSLPDRFASPSERMMQVPQPHPQPYPDRQPYGERHAQNGYDRNGQQYQPNGGGERGERPYDNRNRQFNDRQGQDRQNQDRQGQERQGQDRQSQERQGQERHNRDRQWQDRQNERQGGQNERQPDAMAPFRTEGGGQERLPRDDRQPPRDYDNRGFRNRNREDRPPREPRETFQPREVREPRQPAAEEQPVAGLPAFITSPVATRPAAEPAPVEQPATPDAVSSAPAAEAADDGGFHMRPRRRRRPKAELAEAEGQTGGNEDAPARDPVAD